MILYHFCAAHLLADIKREGLTLGKLPLIERGPERHIDYTRYVEGYQWLTAEPDPKKQSWATQIHIRYSRTAYRLTVKIPLNRLRKLHKAVNFVRHLKAEQRHIVENWAGSEDWYMYRGTVPSQWITKIEEMEE